MVYLGLILSMVASKHTIVACISAPPVDREKVVCKVPAFKVPNAASVRMHKGVELAPSP